MVFGLTDNSFVTGVSYPRSEINAALVRDGTSTLICWRKKPQSGPLRRWGRRRRRLEHVHRLAGRYLPLGLLQQYGHKSTVRLPDTCSGPTGRLGTRILSADHHSGAFNIAFCDGSIHTISYSIDPELHHQLYNRKDGLVVDASKKLLERAWIPSSD